MYSYAQINADGKVHTVMNSNNRIVEIPANDDRLNGCTYVPETGDFVGHRIVVTADKPSIVGDGVDAAVITATVLTWDEQPSNFNDYVIFDVNGLNQFINAVDGVATYTLTKTEAGTVTVKTVNDVDTLVNGSVNIEVTAPPVADQTTTDTPPADPTV